MDQAERDRLNGSSGVMTFFKPDGSSSRFLIHFYYVDETSDSKRFYGSAHNITQLTNLQNHMELLSQYFSDTVIFLKRSISFSLADFLLTSGTSCCSALRCCS